MTSTTIHPTAPTMIGITATLTSAMHHGAGTSGNTSLLRTQDVIQPDGKRARVPYLSANSVRHALRDTLAWHLVRALRIEDGALTKPIVDLLWSGGAVTTTGAQTDLEMARRVEDHLPHLAMLGYAAQSDITAGTLRVSDLILACQENSSRLRGTYAALKPAAAYRGEEFGTRHDVASTPVARMVATAEDLLGVRTTQMIYDRQVLSAGATLEGDITLTAAATPAHTLALTAALALWAPDGRTHLGAATAVGYGRADITFSPTPDDMGAAPQALADHMREHTDGIMSLLTDLTR